MRAPLIWLVSEDDGCAKCFWIFRCFQFISRQLKFFEMHVFLHMLHNQYIAGWAYFFYEFGYLVNKFLPPNLAVASLWIRLSISIVPYQSSSLILFFFGIQNKNFTLA